ncbi:hypothetical protein A0J61_07560 [Choanephora cucurbitarum]|uniref:PPM-type phosphatase domain-containing protein n=1 Tax=Choanephora cucurbitarum TaxID=101091 RepID=A0A1C7N721_9FUNG|nr:hypothetical protein A0J61_07560 [Choanephora cucurbitarum]
MDSTSAELPATRSVDTDLAQLNLADSLRANSSFMKVMATLFHYGNQAMNAAQLVIAVRALNLLPLRGETPKSTIQGIISTARKIARDLKLPDPFRIDKDGSGRQAKYAIADQVLNGVEVPEKMEIPDEPIILRPVYSTHPHATHDTFQGTKRQRKPPSIYSPSTKMPSKKRAKGHLKSKRKDSTGRHSNQSSDIEVYSDEEEDEADFHSLSSEEEEIPAQRHAEVIEEEDTIADYSLLYNPPTKDMDYIDPINFSDYPIAGHFAIVQQKGYSYPRFRSHDKIKIPKIHCEDKFRVTDVVKDGKAIGRLFILADGHGGPGCSEYFVRKTPSAINTLCAQYDPTQLDQEEVRKAIEKDIKETIQALDDEYLALKRQQIASRKPEEHIDNDGCTLILNLFLGEWLVNVNVGDSRTVLISAPEPSPTPIHTTETTNHDYKMDVVFASQDHKPYLEHLARHILENGGEFVDSVQNRVIKIDLDKLREDGNRPAKRLALKNARIRPKDYQPTQDTSSDLSATANWTAQSAVRTTALEQPSLQQQDEQEDKARYHNGREDRVPSLNVARSCGDLDFKMDPTRKIISCEPDVTFIRISDQPYVDHTVLLNGPHKEKRRHFLFMSTDGTFDYMYEETAERQNRAIAKAIGPMIEDGEKIGRYLLEEEERVKGMTIEHTSHKEDETKQETMEVDDSFESQDAMKLDRPEETVVTVNTESHDTSKEKEEEAPEEIKQEEDQVEANKETKEEEKSGIKEQQVEAREEQQQAESKEEENEEHQQVKAKEEQAVTEESKEENMEKERQQMETEESKDEQVKAEEKKEDQMEIEEKELPRIPLLFRELTEEEAKIRKVKERTLIYSARYFANRESAHGFFASTLQDYDDCTIVLVEI